MIICKTENELERALQAKEAKIIFEGSKASEIVQKIENRIYEYKIAKLDNNRIQFTHK